MTKPHNLATLKRTGQYRKDRHGDRMTVEPGEPSPPTWLSREAKAKWKRIVPELVTSAGVCELDRDALAALCDAWGRFVKYTRQIEKEGDTFTTEKGYVGQHPAVAMRDTAFEQHRKLCLEFGLTASARMRVKAPAPKGATKGSVMEFAAEKARLQRKSTA